MFKLIRLFIIHRRGINSKRNFLSTIYLFNCGEAVDVCMSLCLICPILSIDRVDIGWTLENVYLKQNSRIIGGKSSLWSRINQNMVFWRKSIFSLQIYLSSWKETRPQNGQPIMFIWNKLVSLMSLSHECELFPLLEPIECLVIFFIFSAIAFVATIPVYVKSQSNTIFWVVTRNPTQ